MKEKESKPKVCSVFKGLKIHSNIPKLLLIFSTIFCLLFSTIQKSAESPKEQPKTSSDNSPKKRFSRTIRVGILTSMGNPYLVANFPSPMHTLSTVDGSHYDFVSMAGTTPVFVPFDLPSNELTDILKKTDLLLIPGNPPQFEAVPSYQRVVDFVVDWAKYQNKQSVYPVLFLGNGFTNLVSTFDRNPNKVSSMLNCKTPLRNVSKSISLNSEVFQSSAFYSDELFESLNSCSADSVFFNSTCLLPISAVNNNPDFSNQFLKLGTGLYQGSKKFHYHAMLEHAKYPFLGMQFDLSRQTYLRLTPGPYGSLYPRSGINRSASCQRAGFLVSQAFASMVRKYLRAKGKTEDFPVLLGWEGPSYRPHREKMDQTERVYIFHRNKGI